MCLTFNVFHGDKCDNLCINKMRYYYYKFYSKLYT